MKPFIPSWLDEAGLSQAEFRLYCHLCRRADKNGIAFPSVDGREENGELKETAIISVCGMSRRTAWKTIRSLIEKKLIEKLGRGNFGSPNRYKVLVPIGAIEAPNQSPIVSLEAPNEEIPFGAIEAPSFGANEHLLLTQSRPHEGNPLKEIHRRKSTKSEKPVCFDPSIEESQFANWFKSSLPQDQQDRLPKNWLVTFSKAHRELVRLDNRTPEKIREVCQWARTDSFWQGNFHSPAKLRKRNGDGVLYFDVFSEKMKSTPNGKSTSVNTRFRKPPGEDARAKKLEAEYPQPILELP